MTSVHSQGLIQTIDRTQKALLIGTSFSSNEIPLDSATGFFISADGLAIIPSSLLNTSGSLAVTDFEGKSLKINKVVAIHPYAGLTMIQVTDRGKSGNSYLVPSNLTLPVGSNILIVGAPQEPDEGLLYTRSASAFFQPFICRGTFAAGPVKKSMHGSPVLSESGRFAAIVYHLDNIGEPVLLSLTLLGDTLWKSVNQNLEEFNKSPQKILYAHTGIANGLFYQGAGRWVESAKAFSRYLKEVPDRPDIYALRAISRLNYHNLAGSRDDIEHAFYIDKSSYLAAYANALYHLRNNEMKKADDQLRLSLGSNPRFAQAYLELGKLQNASGLIKQAHFSFSKAVESDSLLAAAWYEKGKLAQQFSSNQEEALRDMETAARLNQNLPGVYSLIGAIKINTRDYLDAIRDFNKAINLDPKDGHAYINRGLAWYNVGMKENACKDWESAGKAGVAQAFKLLSRHCSEVRKSFLQNR